jgi:hypothetical protein
MNMQRSVRWSLVIGHWLSFVVFGFLVFCALAAHQAGASGEGQSAQADLPLFTDVTESAGVAHIGDSWGASWGDFNGDGFPDLYAGNHHRPPGLFRNNGDDGTFTDIVELTPLNYNTDRHGVAWGDYDNDGDQDLVTAIGAVGGTADVPRELYQNIRDGHFVDVAEEAGVSDGLARGRSVSWADYDRDGDLDFFAANEKRDEVPNRLWCNNGDGTFTDVAEEAGVADSLRLFAGGFVDYDRDGWPDIFVLGRDHSLLYHNSGDGTFEDVSAASGLADQSGNGYAWGDYDGDGDADLFVGNTVANQIDHVEAEGRKVRFIGEADGDQDGFDLEVAGKRLEFKLELQYLELQYAECLNLACIHLGKAGSQPDEHPFKAGPEMLGTPKYTPGVSLGYYIWWDKGTDLWHVRWSTPERTQFAGVVVTSEPVTSIVPVDMEPYIPPSGKARLWRNEGDGTFTEVSAEAGLTALGNYGTGNWVDFDNDGWLDLFVVHKGDFQTGNGPNRLFWNKGDGTFQDVAALVEVTGTTERSCNVSAWADFDRNGFLDLFTMNGAWGGNWPFNKGPNQLFRNEGNANHWLQLELVGNLSNRSGIGAVVKLSAGGRTQVQTRTDGVKGYCQDGGPLQFGLGDSTVVDSIIIDWPSGVHQVITNVAADQRLTVIEPMLWSIYLPIIFR